MIGKTISHYKILEKLGEGGMGVVYKAEDTKLKRTVALKFLPAQALENDEERERFIHEARAAAAVDHSNVCTVHEIDKAEGRTFIVMSYIEGRNLREIVDSGPMELDEAVSLAIQIGEGLAAAHEKGVVHRDIKTANVILTPKGQAKIMDFGLAKSSAGVVVTQATTTLGTVAYMSPEQTRGEQPDGRTDIWSLGAVLYEMVTGRRPFRGDYEQAVIYSILNSAPEPVTALRTGVPLDLERVILRCLEKNPDDRYQTAVDLVSDLRRVRRYLREEAGAAVQAGESGTVVSDRMGGASRISERRGPGGPFGGLRKWALVIAVVAMVAIAVIVFKPYFMPPVQIDAGDSATGGPATTGAPSGGADVETATSKAGRRMIVVLPFENLGPPENAYFADGMTEEITSRLASVKALGVISRTSAVQYDRAGKTIRDIGEDLGVDYVLEGTVRWDGTMSGESRVRVTPQLIRVSDDTHLWAESYDRELRDIFSVQSDIAEQVVGQLGITLLEPERGAIEQTPTDNLDAYNAYLRGIEHAGGADWLREDIELAEDMFERALTLDPGFALAAADLSINHSRMYWAGYDPTDERLAKSLAAARKALELQPGLPEGHLAMGYYYYWGHLRYEEALREFALAEEGLPNDAKIIEAVAYVKRRQGHFEEAAELLKRGLELSPNDALVAFNLADSYTALRRYAVADTFHGRTISIAPDQAAGYCGRANNLWLWKGDLQAAREALQRTPVVDDIFYLTAWYEQELLERDYEAALERLSRWDVDFREFVLFCSPPPLLAARVYDFMEKPDLAHAMYDSTRGMLEELLESGFDDFSVHICLGMAYAGLGRRDDAVREGRLAVELNSISIDAAEAPYTLMMLAEIYVMVADNDAAIDELEHLLSIPSKISVPMLRLAPRWDPLRDHPRFQRLLEKYAENGS